MNIPMLHVDGTRLKDSAGKVVRLQGVNVPSLDWSNTGDHLTLSINRALTDWKAKLIRIPLSQDRWFGKSGDSSAEYRTVVDGVVRQIAAQNSYALLDLHWSNGGKWGENIGQHCMPDDLSVLFWKDLAKRYANHPAVLFDLYNEPHDVSWEIWKSGGMVEERNDDPKRGLHLTYHTPGMQALLDTVRATGAKNVVVAGGLDWGYDLSGVLKGHALRDPNGNGILYGTHIYPWKKDWDTHVTPVAQKHAVFVGEVGTKPWKPTDPPHENVYTESWAPEVIAYMNKHQLSWTAWSFHPSANPCLLTGWDYKPTGYWGVYVKAALTGAK
ncbi:MAG: cellulase family glycosylhydrolase [Armatimonadetes bacterium]|nr:cellulase family glycosylhydrolase [Armatimonadota bacterium]